MFEPLVRIATTGFPYSIGLVVALSILSGLASKRTEGRSLLAAALSQAGVTCAFLFLVFGLYVQIRGEPASFVELLPSAILTAFVLGAASMIWLRSREPVGLGTVALALALISGALGVFLAAGISVLPKLVG